MNLPAKIFAVGLLAAAAPLGAAAAAPIGASMGLHNATSPYATNPAVQTVQWRGRWGGWGGRGWGWRGGFWPGLAAGAIVSGALAATQPGYGYDYDYGPGYSYGYDPGYTYAPAPGYSTYGYSPGYSTYGYSSGGNDVAYCEQRYRSYDPASGTYLGYDGIRHPCP